MTSSGLVDSTAVSLHGCRFGWMDADTMYTDYSFFGNNVAVGQFQAQVWGPVCGDPALSEVQARESVEFDWTEK
jgi:hypothetical protein